MPIPNTSIIQHSIRRFCKGSDVLPIARLRVGKRLGGRTIRTILVRHKLCRKWSLLRAIFVSPLPHKTCMYFLRCSNTNPHISRIAPRTLCKANPVVERSACTTVHSKFRFGAFLERLSFRVRFLVRLKTPSAWPGTCACQWFT